jgi:hypothetical protein
VTHAICACCERPYDDEWVVWCPVTRELAEMLRGDGLTTNYPVTMRLDDTGAIVVTEHRPPASLGEER